MSRRTEKVESLVRQTVASQFIEQLPAYTAAITVTKVDVSPDLRNANVWIAVLAKTPEVQSEIFDQTLEIRPDIQRHLAGKITTKFVPRLTFKLDTGGQYAEHISRLLNEL